jgi:hypothetical protein
MGANGISRLATKQLRQEAKLDLAATKLGLTYNIDYLPGKYVGNEWVVNENADGLLTGRPWVERMEAANPEIDIEAGGGSFDGDFDPTYVPTGYSISGNTITNNSAGDMVWVFGVTKDDLPTTGKWYWEVELSGNADNCYMGIVDVGNLADATDTTSSTGLFNNGMGWWENGGVNIDGSSNGVSGGVDFSASGGERLQFAWDADAEELQVGLDGTFSTSVFSRSFPSGARIAINCRKETCSAQVFTAEVDQSYSPPTDYLALA